MTKFVRLAALAAVTFAATPAFAQVAPSNGQPTATVRITKPLTLTRVAHMDLGTVVVWGNGTVAMDQAGVITCPAAALVCAASGTPAEFTVSGSNNRVVQINTPASVTLSTIAGDNLTLVPNAPPTVTLPNSGVGNALNFKIGGSVALLDSTPGGTYVGTMAVTVQYQ
jgi:hypothetical protein